MKTLFNSRRLSITIALTAIVLVLFMIIKLGGSEKTELITTTVDTGTVRQLVSVSGIADAKQTADLAFPVVGTVQTVGVSVGDVVETGAILATLDARSLYADRQDALAALTRAVEMASLSEAGGRAARRARQALRTARPAGRRRDRLAGHQHGAPAAPPRGQDRPSADRRRRARGAGRVARFRAQHPSRAASR